MKPNKSKRLNHKKRRYYPGIGKGVTPAPSRKNPKVDKAFVDKIRSLAFNFGGRMTVASRTGAVLSPVKTRTVYPIKPEAEVPKPIRPKVHLGHS